MNVLVIGGNGFIGSHLVDHLLLKGHKVRVFDVAHERYRQPLPDVDYRISSLENIPALYEALLSIEVVFLLACTSVPSTSNIDPISDIKNNLLPTLNVLSLASKLGLRRVVFFSSGGAVYGNPLTMPIREDHPLNPISSYGIVKATIEMYLFLFQRLHGFKPLVLRPSNPYGPRQGHFLAQGVISTYLRKIKLNERITVFGDGNSAKDYLYVIDLIQLAYELTFAGAVGTYNVGSGIGITINQIIEWIKKIVGKSPEIVYQDRAIYDVQKFVLDISKTSKLLGERPQTSLEMGIRETWQWVNSTNL